MTETSVVRVQKNVPIPAIKARGRQGRRTPKYPWAVMEVGDSFLFPLTISRGCYQLARQASKQGLKFEVHRVEDGYRCWRVQ